MQCFVCSEHLDGDEVFVEHHLNACLDRQGSSTARATPSTATAVAAPAGFTAPSLPARSPSPPLSPHFASDAALALALAQELSAEPALEGAQSALGAAAGGRAEGDAAFERDRLLALSLAREEGQLDALSSAKGKGAATAGDDASVEGAACPVCGAGWDDRALPLPPSAGSNAGAIAQREKVLAKRAEHVRACGAAKGLFEDEAGLQHGVPDVDGDEQGDEELGLAAVGGERKRAVRKSWTGDVGGKDEVKGTPGLIPLLRNALAQSNLAPQGRTRAAWLASAQTEHIPTRVKDWGWGCGYKNAQMIFSSLRHLPQYAAHFASTSPRSGSGESPGPVPTIREWQEMIEQAWAAGFDPDGRSHFGGKLVNSRRWIGTTEVYVALTWMGVRAHVVDFPKLPGTGSLHEPLLKWLVDYFRLPPPHPHRLDAFSALQASAGGPVRMTPKEPLYLQHRGHSRTVVGVEYGGGKRRRKGKGEEEEEEEEAWLLVFDPGRPVPQELKSAAAALASSSPSRAPAPLPSTSAPSSPPAAKKSKLSASPPSARGGFGVVGGGGAGVGTGGLQFGDVLKVVRVNMRELKRRDAYQLLYIAPDEPPLAEYEKVQRKTVRSTVVTGS
ncbi:hypothetical protein JCM10450v2_000962 [Rhodotorula kratochvilovae]